MPSRHSFGEIHLDVTAGREQPLVTPGSETPFRIAILGDFSGRTNRGLSESGDALASRRPQMIDRDSFDSVLARIAPRLELAPGGEDAFRISLKFGDLDDFHPDRLFEQVQMFQKLRETRQKLNDPVTFAKTASELGLVGKQPSAQIAPPAPAHRISGADIQRVVSGSLLDEMVEATEGRAAEEYPSKPADEWTTLLNKIVAPHVVAKADPRQAELVALIDKATSAQMAALLHARDFQALEAAWRAVFFLVRNIETDSQLKLFLIDVSKEELAQDLLASSDLSSTGIYKLLVEKTVGTPGAEPWAVIAGNFNFGPTLKDAELLGRMAKVAAGAGAPFIAGASPRLLGCDSVLDLPDPRHWKIQMSGETAASWQSLRSSPEARFVGLGLPRFLLRLPYGKDTEPAELFQFEEMPDPAAHENYLWCNSAFACALLLAQSFAEQGWELRPGSILEISGLPVYTHTVESELRNLPCAEVLLTQTAADKMMEKGFMPLASLKDQPTVRLVRFQAIADPLSSLAGRWSS
ncbi:MAG: type VI secretion system contractile sheath large subunit [Terriglobia bacterium]